MLDIDRKDASAAPGRWPDCPAGQELDSDKLRTLTDALGDLKIVGVRPSPRASPGPEAEPTRRASS